MAKTKNSFTDELYNGIISKDIAALAKAITLVESNKISHISEAQKLIEKVLPITGNSLRIGITGGPGAGKSTFIDALGYHLCELGNKVAVLAIDPSSSISKGSILGDKTRMERLASNDSAFIRPSPSRGNLGGVARKTKESILLCEAAGFNIIIIETIGVGQSETVVRSIVDALILLILPGAGDELQGIKKGSVELADFIVINKADSENTGLANITQRDYANALNILNSPTLGWKPQVFKASAIFNKGIKEIWNSLNDFIATVKSNGYFNERRIKQNIEWMYRIFDEEMLDMVRYNPEIQKSIPKIESELMNNKITSYAAAKKLIKLIFKSD